MQQTIQSILDPLPIPKAVKAQIWDEFHAATPEDFQARFDKLNVPRGTKAALWDLKMAAAEPPPGRGASGGWDAPPSFNDEREWLQVATDQAGRVIAGIPKAVTGIPGMVAAVADAVGSPAKQWELLKGAVQPVTTSVKGIAALMGQADNPTDEEWAMAAEGAGANAGGILLGVGFSKLPIKAKVAALKEYRAKLPDKLTTGAATIRDIVANTDIRTPATKTGITVAALKTAARPAGKLAARGMEATARRLSKNDKAPPVADVPQFEGRPIAPNPQTPPQRMAAPPRENVPPPSPDRLPMPLTQPRPGMATRPGLNINDREFMQSLNPSGVPHDVSFRTPGTAPMREVPMPNAPASGTPMPPVDFKMIEAIIKPSGRFAKQRSILVDAEGKATARGTQLIAEVPELVGMRPGLEADAALVAGLKRTVDRINSAQEAIPPTSTVPSKPIIDGLTALKAEYDAYGNPATSASIQKVLNAWEKMGTNIPWDQFRKAKQKFFEEQNIKSGPMRRAYGLLMEASGKMSKALGVANKAYSAVKQAVDNANIDVSGKIDNWTGRRIMDVAKAGKPTMATNAEQSLAKTQPSQPVPAVVEPPPAPRKWPPAMTEKFGKVGFAISETGASTSGTSAFQRSRMGEFLKRRGTKP